MQTLDAGSSSRGAGRGNCFPEQLKQDSPALVERQVKPENVGVSASFTIIGGTGDVRM